MRAMDERIREHLVSDEISMGDYVLTGGELPAMTMTDDVRCADSWRRSFPSR